MHHPGAFDAQSQPAAELARLCASYPLVFAQRTAADDGINDPVLASARLAQVYSPHRLRVLGRADEFSMSLRTGGVGSIALSMLSFNAEVELAQRASESFYLVTTQLRGRSQIDVGRDRGGSGGGGAGLVVVDSATRDVVKRFSADSQRLHVRLGRNELAALCAQLLGQGDVCPPEFEPVMTAGGPAQRRWLAVAQLLLDHACSPLDPLLAPRVHRQLAELAMLTLLTEHRHSHSERLRAPVPSLSPRHVRAAEEHMRAHAGEALTLADMARAASVSIRTLSAGFQAWRGTTPMRHLREMRLTGARDDLMRGRAAVSDVALRWGFGHLGRFAADYARRFGEPPSATLRRSR
jgi:AraC-like DNA-binding protein